MCAILCTAVYLPQNTQAAAKIKLSKSSVKINVGDSYKLSLKKVGKNNYAGIKWATSAKKIVAIKKTKKNNSIVYLNAKAQGKATIRARLSGRSSM